MRIVAWSLYLVALGCGVLFMADLVCKPPITTVWPGVWFIGAVVLSGMGGLVEERRAG